MSLEKIDKYINKNKTIQDNSNILNKIKKSILDSTGVEVSIKLKPPISMILICESASASSELISQKDQILEVINSIIDNKKINNLIIRQN